MGCLTPAVWRYRWKKPLIDTGMFTADDLGVIGSAFFYTYAFGRLTNGFLADHANIRRFYPFGLLMSALINLAMGYTAHLWVWAVLWGFNGWFQGFGSPASVVAMAHWFSNRERGSYYGFWSTAHALGEGLTFVGTAAFVNSMGWRAGFTVPGIACIVVAAGLYLALQDRPRTLGLNRPSCSIAPQSAAMLFLLYLSVMKTSAFSAIGMGTPRNSLTDPPAAIPPAGCRCW